MKGFSDMHGARAQAFMLAAAVGVSMALAGSASAQEVSKGLTIWKSKAGCVFCHGWAGDGNGDAHAPGDAPSLRDTQLSRDDIRTTIQCGRPGTAMPHFDRFAYTDKRCYESTAEDLGDQVPKRSPTTLQPAEIDAIADYVATKLKGAGPVTRQECQEYYDSSAEQCKIYPDRQAVLPQTEQHAEAAAVVPKS